MAKPASPIKYEERFEFTLWTLIKRRAEEKDISYVEACREVLPEYVRTIRYGDTEFEDAAIQKRQKELADIAQLEQEE
jgi:hypothetical protein